MPNNLADIREQASQADADALKPVGLWELVRYFLRLGSFGFGGPIALAGYMQRDLIPRRWISEKEYLEGLAFSQMMPGPLAAQLAMWIGFIRHGTVGASLVGILLYHPPKNRQKPGALVAGFLAVPAIAGLSAMPVLSQLGAFFVKAGAFTFGSGLAIVPFLHQGVVLQHHWLNERQFLDAVAVGIITPGPVVITAAFVGYLVAGFMGALEEASPT